jgi:hypothetical protein
LRKKLKNYDRIKYERELLEGAEIIATGQDFAPRDIEQIFEPDAFNEQKYFFENQEVLPI